MLHLLKIAQTVIKTPEDIYAEFRSYLNMSPSELELWLKTPSSRNLILESTEADILADKKISSKILKIASKKKFMLTKGDYACLEKVNAFIANQYEHKPVGDLTQSNWRYTLMNVGHDPLINNPEETATT